MYQQSKKKDLKLSLTVIVGMQFYEEKIEKEHFYDVLKNCFVF